MQEIAVPSATTRKKESRLRKRIWKNKWIYVMLLPGILYFLIFKYLPMYGLVISFQDYKPFKGILGSEWVGFEHFARLFNEPDFLNILTNTLILFGLNLLFYFPVPIILALMLNEVRNSFFKKTFQTLVYLPHFMSWVIIVSIGYVMLTMDGGIVNELLVFFGFEKINFLLSTEWFRPTYIIQVIWREAGWGTIVYLAAIASVDPQLYEAARMDGANRLRQIWHITLPAIRSVIIILLILKIGDVLELGFEHVYLLLNSMNREVAEIIDTYVYTAAMKQGQFSYSTAIGFFKSFVGLILVMVANKLAKKMGEEGVY
ncbi:sugar ABC transporter permease [Paenibacillus urinalis]|uniref:Sugar ABC transporter permease n=1 Tax=Paenibacillus urinalis TaxID=521520 RepID=A0AAX3MWK7_9BACL|nr:MULTISPECIES: sugar ABC transporter permease [Paenibacillus]WDH82000.1 sugar ABC transporter permease [Paenibacillus urinalis]WDH98047.1 sugar ABC transporter permease [Paenibacillus urinalis]WDI01729.1 sugar ABC transporter permease [Paenibacillus urinalis]GAK42467.1 polysaccharide ABC transporter permease protein [Paenibacillus sp. TCA20]